MFFINVKAKFDARGPRERKKNENGGKVVGLNPIGQNQKFP